MQQELKELKKRIQAKIPDLTESQKVVANYIVENTQKFALSSIRELEQELNTSKSTIVRLAQVLGYNGFQDLKSTFLKKIRSDFDPMNRYKNYLSTTESESDYFEIIAKESVENINSTLQIVDRSQFRKAVALIEKADSVYTLGSGIPSYLADITSHHLNEISIKSTKLRYGGISFTEQIVNLAPNDIIIAFSFPAYSQETIDACSYAYEKGIKIIAITDKVTSEIVQYSEAHIQAVVESQLSSNSYMAVLIVMYSLFAQVGFDLKNKTLETIESITHIRKKHSGNKN